MEQNKNYCVIMAGGIGSRFWPMSTTEMPKQFLDILGTGKTMIQQTFDRIQKIIPIENVFIITNTEYVEITRKQIPELPIKNIVGEPMLKNTAACNLYMSNKIAQIDANANLVILPADHLILKENIFLEKINTALEFVSENNDLITLGIQPTRPDTGYGYIQYSNNNQVVEKVETFTEKPNIETAQEFIKSGKYLWNSGMFIWNVKTIKKAFETHLPEMNKLFSGNFYNTPEEQDSIKNIYLKVEQISIDNGILEKANNVYVLPSDLGWSDLGTWTSVFENSKKDSYQNTKSEGVKLYNTEKSIIRIKDHKKTAVIDGLNDFIVVDTEKALLICPKHNDQLIKQYIADLNNKIQ